MKLVEHVLDNISSEEISDVASEFGFSSQTMSSVIHAMIPGVLSAFKARIVSSMNSGDMSSLLGVISNTESNFNINELFDDNSEALNTLYQRISEFSGIEISKISEIVPSIMPTISNAISTMFQEYGSNALMTSGSNFISELIKGNNGYDTAIDAANNFLGSVFGNVPEEAQVQNSGQNLVTNAVTSTDGDSFVQNLFDLFDQDNDGSVMDDIYRMLVR